MPFYPLNLKGKASCWRLFFMLGTQTVEIMKVKTDMMYLKAFENNQWNSERALRNTTEAAGRTG